MDLPGVAADVAVVVAAEGKAVHEGFALDLVDLDVFEVAGVVTEA